MLTLVLAALLRFHSIHKEWFQYHDDCSYAETSLALNCNANFRLQLLLIPVSNTSEPNGVRGSYILALYLFVPSMKVHAILSFRTNLNYILGYGLFMNGVI